MPQLIDRFWSGLINWATVEQPRLAAMQQYELIKARILEHAQGERILREFDAISDLKVGGIELRVTAGVGECR